MTEFTAIFVTPARGKSRARADSLQVYGALVTVTLSTYRSTLAPPPSA